MQIIAGQIRMAPGTRDEFFSAVGEMVKASQAEAGCQAYVFTPDPDDVDLIHLYELWDSAEALAEHAASAHMATWKQASAKLSIVSRDLELFEVSDRRPL